MTYVGGAVFLASLALLVYCVLDVIRTPDDEVRNLPKLLWLVLCLFFPLVGGIAWLVLGRPQRGAGGGLVRGGGSGRPARPGRGVLPGFGRPAPTRPPDDDEAFLRQLRERAAEQRRIAEERAREQARPDDEAP